LAVQITDGDTVNNCLREQRAHWLNNGGFRQIEQ